MRQNYQFVHLENKNSTYCLQDKPVYSITYSVDFNYSLECIMYHKDKILRELIWHLEKNNQKPNFMFVGYETYKKIVAIESFNLEGLVFPTHFCDMQIVVVPHVHPNYLEFGVNDPLKQFQQEYMRVSKGECNHG